MSSVVVAGATGAIGREVVIESVADPRVERVVALSRRLIDHTAWLEVFGSRLDLGLAKRKLDIVCVDWEGLTNNAEAYLSSQPKFAASLSNAQIVAMCMGTTRKDAGSAEAFRRCDLEYVTAFGKAVKRLAGPRFQCFSQISSEGAKASSWFLYLKTKGEADEATISLQLPKTSIFRPGLLGRGDKARTVESFASCFVTPMSVERVAKALLRDALESSPTSNAPSVQFFSNSDINRLAPSS